MTKMKKKSYKNRVLGFYFVILPPNLRRLVPLMEGGGVGGGVNVSRRYSTPGIRNTPISRR